MFNKKEGSLYKGVDDKLLQSISMILASVIDQCDDLHRAWMLVYQLKQIISSVIQRTRDGHEYFDDSNKQLDKINSTMCDINLNMKKLVESQKT